MEAQFKRCSLCGHSWPSRERLLADPAIELIGYQPDFEELGHGTLLFNHNAAGCETTMEIEIGEFFDLAPDARHEQRRDGTDDCHGHCLRIDDLERCAAPCANAWAREVALAVQGLLRSSRGRAT